jgi:hypothetical protein
MKSAAEYRQYAKECRALAKGFTGERRQQSLELAETWEDLARRVDSGNNRHLAGMLKAVYDEIANEPVPARIRELLWRLDTADRDGS